MRSKLFLLALLGILSAAAVLAGEAQKEEKPKPDTYSAVAVGTRGAVAAKSIQLTFRVSEWTTDEKVKELLEILSEQGEDALRKAMEKLNVGRINPTGSVGIDIAAARRFKLEDGKTRIRLVTARNMSFLELYRSGRSRDYPFSMIEFDVDDEGKGEGFALYAVRVRFVDGQLEVESYGQPSVNIVNVKKYD